jgi:hypothetical protein
VVGNVGEEASIILQTVDSINLAFTGLFTVVAAAGIGAIKGEQS